eukprot:1664793-Pleurochrysis_carterae.AAC.1
MLHGQLRAAKSTATAWSGRERARALVCVRACVRACVSVCMCMWHEASRACRNCNRSRSRCSTRPTVRDPPSGLPSRACAHNCDLYRPQLGESNAVHYVPHRSFMRTPHVSSAFGTLQSRIRVPHSSHAFESRIRVTHSSHAFESRIR